MSHGNGQSDRPRPPGAAHQPEFHWDLSAAAAYTCEVANSTAGVDDVLLNFGAIHRSGDAPAEVSVKMIRQFALRPLTAMHLRDMLRNIIADIDADQPAGRA